MRTDAKIGFAIGAVLLAVLTVYAIVVPKKRTASNTGVAIVVPKGLSNDSSSTSTPSNGVVLTDKTPDPTPAPPVDTNPSSPTASDQKSPIALPPGNTQVADAKGSDGVDWNKLIGTPNTPSTPNTPNTLYSVTPNGSNTPPVTENNSTAGHTTSTPAADPQSFRPSEDVTEPVQSKSNDAAGATPHARSSTAHKTSRTRSSDSGVASAASHGTDQYVVEAGDTLSGIAAAHYGAAHYYTQIIKANPSIDPNRMRPGTKLILPDLSSAIAAAAAKNSDTAVADMESPRTSIHLDAEGAAGGGVFTPGNSVDTLFAATSNSPSESGGTYTVHGGDNLYRISKKLYGTSKMAHQIFAANQSEIGPDMSKLKLGMVLTLPEAPTN